MTRRPTHAYYFYFYFTQTGGVHRCVPLLHSQDVSWVESNAVEAVVTFRPLHPCLGSSPMQGIEKAD